MPKQPTVEKEANAIEELRALRREWDYKVFEVTLRIFGDLFSELSVSQKGDRGRRLFFASEKTQAEVVRRATSMVSPAERKTPLGQFLAQSIKSTAQEAVLLPRLGIRSRRGLRQILTRFNQDLDFVVSQARAFEPTVRFVEDLQDAADLPTHLEPHDLITKMLEHFSREETAPTKARRAVLALLLGQDAVTVTQVNAAEKNIEQWKTLTALSPDPKRIKPEMLIIASVISFRRAFSNTTGSN